ncbi:hypothetical protein SMU94_03162 [Streptococcus mutans 66-2A]|nr:hypothetical protein SMU94_03162 [Streptococcus mutans 66-2A]
MRKFEKEETQGLLGCRGKGTESKPNLTEAEELQLKIKQYDFSKSGKFTTYSK